MTVFNTQTFSITRTTAQTLNAVTGIFSSGTTTTTSGLLGNIQPAGKAELERLPEGLQGKETILVITKTPVLLNDVITYAGKNYNVDIVENFSNHLSIGNYEAICTLKAYQGL